MKHAGKQFKLGKHPAEFDPRTLRFGAYLTQSLPAPPATVNWGKGITAWGMMGNDTYGDCTCAAAGHMIMEWTANTTTEVVIPDPKILAFYNHFAHGNADAGANMLQVLKYWRQQGLGGHKIDAFAALEPKSDVQAQDAVDLFGACYIGLALPNFAVPPNTDLSTIPWVVPPQGPVGDAAPNQQNGHCVPAVAYDQRNLYVVTWGALKAMTWQFYETYMDEAFAVLSGDWFNPQTRQAPPGFNLAALQQDLKQIGTG